MPTDIASSHDVFIEEDYLANSRLYQIFRNARSDRSAPQDKAFLFQQYIDIKADDAPEYCLFAYVMGRIQPNGVSAVGLQNPVMQILFSKAASIASRHNEVRSKD